MTQSVHPDDAWRDPDGVLAMVQPGNPLRLDGWERLRWVALTDKIDAVLMYARLGLHPILLYGITETGRCTCGDPHEGSAKNSIGKHPIGGEWQKKPLDVPTLCADLDRDWRRNIGLRMGKQPSGLTLVCIDVDGPRELLDPLEAKRGKLPPTLTATSGKGLHMIFRLSDGARVPKNRTRIAEGIDVRSEGGQIVAAPSTHYSGRKYRWLTVMEPAVLP